MKINKRHLIISIIDYTLLPVGLILLGIGLWMFHPWVSLTVIGAIITLTAIAIEIRGK